jgi:transposase
MAELDGYAKFADDRGEGAVGQLLRAVGRLVNVNLRRKVDVACRHEAGTFAILLPNTPCRKLGALLVAERRRVQLRLRWHLHDLELDLDLPPRVLDRYVWQGRVEARLRGLPQTTGRRIALELVDRCRELTVSVRSLEREIRTLMRCLAPELLALPGCSALSAAQLVGQVAGASRFRSEAAFAMHTGTAPLPASSGRTTRHRLNRRGNRRLNSVIHMIAVTQVRMHPPAIAFLERKRAEGMSTREALRCLKQHIARTVFRTMCQAEQARLVCC